MSLATSSSVGAALACGEPTQASVRALLEELTGGVLPADGASVGIDRDWMGEEDGVVFPVESARGVRGLAAEEAGEGVVVAGPLPARLPKVAYVLPGLPAEGSGGSHSLTQEARGLRALGARAWICVPEDSLATALALYGEEDGLFVPYPEEEPVLPGVSGASVREAIADADVAVATEYPSVDLLARLARERPGLVCAYYVQDYEPLFAAPESSRADRALLSYRAHPDQLLFAKTHWLRNLVSAVHGVGVAKVRPSLDRALFHAGGRVVAPGRDGGPPGAQGQVEPVRRDRILPRADSGYVLNVAAMIRPRTPRRRPVATLEALSIVARTLGERVKIHTFGCDEDSFALLDGDRVPGIRHLGLLSRLEVANLMRRCDVFIDASAYQAFGRTGLEAMACGVVPLLPALGGVREYAIDGENAVILADGSPREIAGAVLDLFRDPTRLGRLREAGVAAARAFSIERAARSQLELFAAVLERRRSASAVAAR